MSDLPDDVALWRLPELRALALLSVFAFTSFFLTLASLPVWAVDGGASTASAGIVSAALLVATVLCQSAVPAAERRLGTPRLLALGLVLLGAPTPLYLVSQALPWLAAVSALRGIGFAVLTVLGAALTARLAPPARRGGAIGLYGLATAVPNLLFVPAGAGLALGGHFAWAAVLGASPLLAVPLVGRLAAGPEGVPARAAGPWALRAVLVPCLILGAVTLSGNGLVTFLPIERPDGAVATVALLAFGACGTLSRWRAGRFADRARSTGALLPASIDVAAAGMALTAAGLSAGTAVGIAAGAGVTGLGYGAVQNLTLLDAFARAGPDRASAASAAWNAAFDSGAAVGAWVVGIAASGAGLSATFAGCAVLVGLTVPLALGAATRGRAALR